MFKILGDLPHKVTVACSGGVDSMAIVSFLKNGGRDITIAYFDHGTEHGTEAFHFLKAFCNANDLKFIFGRVQQPKHDRESWEEYWRNERYKWFSQVTGPIIMGHHLGDQIETWIFSCLRGMPKLIPYRRNHIIRPFLLASREELISASKVDKWIEDPSNADDKYMRNFIRHHLMLPVKVVNPGIEKTVRKLTLRDFNECESH